jgi:hypothetical protein
MESLPKLPLPLEELPETVRRFCDTSGPAPMRMMAARGGVPVMGNDLVTMLAQLSADPDAEVKKAALETLSGLPDEVLLPACQGDLHQSVLGFLAEQKKDDDNTLLLIVANSKTADITVERTASGASEQVCERIAINEQRLLNAPKIIEALYKNRNTRMSTADRLIEMAGRNGIQLTGLPAFEQHLEAVQDQLIPEPTVEPLPTDMAFTETLDDYDWDDTAFEIDDADGSESMTDDARPLAMRIKDMDQGEKIRLAAIGSSGARALLVRDPDKSVAYAAISSPSVTAEEAAGVAMSREVDDMILRYIGNRREWLRSHELKRALVFNPKTPVGIAMKFLSHMRLNDLKKLAHSKEVAGQIKTVATQWLERRQKQ